MASLPISKKIVLVIGGTGVQGLAVVKALLHPAEDGTPSPYAVRVLTRDPTNARAQQLAQDGVEVVKGLCSALIVLTVSDSSQSWLNRGSFQRIQGRPMT